MRTTVKTVPPARLPHCDGCLGEKAPSEGAITKNANLQGDGFSRARQEPIGIEADIFAGGSGRPKFPAGLTFATHVADFQQLADSSPEWRSEYIPLEKGPFTGALTAAHTANLQLALVEYSRGYSFSGDTPASTSTFLMPLPGAHGGVYLGRVMRELDIAATDHGQGSEFFSKTSTKQLVLSVDRSLLESVVDSLWLNNAHRINDNLFHFLDNWHRTEFLCGAQQLLTLALDEPEMLTRPPGSNSIERRLLENLMDACVSEPRRSSKSERNDYARRARAYFADRLHDAVSLTELCGTINASKRTLQVAFQETYGAPPIVYLRSLRLNGARRELRSGSGLTVTEVALKWGFLHFGHFSANYRRAFGETPSETLLNARTAGRSYALKVATSASAAGRLIPSKPISCQRT